MNEFGGERHGAWFGSVRPLRMLRQHRECCRPGRSDQAGSTEEADSMRPFRKEQLGKVRTKIVATLGPASSDPAILRMMVEAGVDVFRLNFSHGTHQEHTAQL